LLQDWGRDWDGKAKYFNPLYNIILDSFFERKNGELLEGFFQVENHLHGFCAG
jgi:hypothetical protein